MKKEVLNVNKKTQSTKMKSRDKVVREWDTLFNIDNVKPKDIGGIREFKKLLPDLLGMEVVHMEPISDGVGLDEIKGMIIFLEGPGEKQIALEISLGGLDDNKIFVEFYQ